ncbi:MAG TPA: sugar phosphate isomerase/epimerase family protein [Anaeromyxobacteraceae bacterium]|nr:sugar phosphate isomerase/epimerase family protein [Anaeromyxobacteraceae bacterium]
MRLVVSNIAWKPDDDEAVGSVLRECGADAVELAPTAYWPDPLIANAGERAVLRRAWEGRGLPVVALQSLLFGYPQLNLFDPAPRDATRERLAGMLEVAADLGAGVLVFGSPRNRARGALGDEEALAVAVPFFRALGDRAAALGVCLCIEPNPPAYGCDFVTTPAQGRELVARVGSPGFGLHLDAAGTLLAGEDPVAEAGRAAATLRHFHASAPQLGPVGPGAGVDYAGAIGALVRGGYRGDVSIEMRSAEAPEARLAAVRRAVETIRPLVPRRPPLAEGRA